MASYDREFDAEKQRRQVKLLEAVCNGTHPASARRRTTPAAVRPGRPAAGRITPEVARSTTRDTLVAMLRAGQLDADDLASERGMGGMMLKSAGWTPAEALRLAGTPGTPRTAATTSTTRERRITATGELR
jgi:hypothetical protein